MNETRTITISLNKAREWYRSGNSTLKELSLQAFSKDELRGPKFEEIEQLVGGYHITREEEVLKILAEYFKKPSDVIKDNGVKYFIAISYGKYTVMEHNTVKYPGIAYFLRRSDANDALRIFKEFFDITD